MFSDTEDNDPIYKPPTDNNVSSSSPSPTELSDPEIAETPGKSEVQQPVEQLELVLDALKSNKAWT